MPTLPSSAIASVCRMRRDEGCASNSHNIPSARVVADELAMLDEGRILAQGTVADLDASDDPLVQAFMRSEGGG